LAILGFEAVGGKELKEVLPTACGLELIHTYSLIHDDLPAMDNDEMRRGRPTVHRQFDEATAILAGDGLYSLAFELFSLGPAREDLKFRVIGEIARATGPRGMVGGQQMDIDPKTESTPPILRHLHLRKTAYLIATALKCGGILGQGPEPAVEVLFKNGIYLGMLFQITDDILDLTGDSALLGKAVHKDLAQGRLTYPGLYGLAGARHRALGYAQRAEKGFTELGRSFQVLADLTRFVLDRWF
jgi:geranylgeranyl diphosphate synthase type II